MNAGPIYKARPPKVLFFGMPGTFSWPSLRALLASGVEVCAVVLPASQSPGRDLPALYRRESPRRARSLLPVLNSSLQTGIVQLAEEWHIPLWEVARMSDAATVSTFAAYQPDLICVACFTLRIPRAILDIPRLGSLNVHPSLLPDHRGPVPLFWAFRQGLRQWGVTIHMMDEGMDTGDMLAQDIIEVPDGISYAQLELQCAQRGGELLAQAVGELYEGHVVRIAQDESKSRYFSFPTAEDYIVPVAEWSALHVYNFICGVAEWGGAVKLRADNEHFIAQKATSYSHEIMCGAADAEYCWRGEEMWIRCKEGWICVTKPVTAQ